jgi:hypothetical protein
MPKQTEAQLRQQLRESIEREKEANERERVANERLRVSELLERCRNLRQAHEDHPRAIEFTQYLTANSVCGHHPSLPPHFHSPPPSFLQQSLLYTNIPETLSVLQWFAHQMTPFPTPIPPLALPLSNVQAPATSTSLGRAPSGSGIASGSRIASGKRKTESDTKSKAKARTKNHPPSSEETSLPPPINTPATSLPPPISTPDEAILENFNFDGLWRFQMDPPGGYVQTDPLTAETGLVFVIKWENADPQVDDTTYDYAAILRGHTHILLSFHRWWKDGEHSRFALSFISDPVFMGSTPNGKLRLVN